MIELLGQLTDSLAQQIQMMILMLVVWACSPKRNNIHNIIFRYYGIWDVGCTP